MQLVENKEEYWEFIRELRNMDGVRQGFVQQEYISKDSHHRYMKENCNFFYICVDNSVLMGYIGVIDCDIRVATHPQHQGKGVASFMLNEVMKLHPKATAKVKIENKASLRLFEKCGFVKKFYILEKE
jgi:RimJ/RimL family protein N-acetyltransferase